MDEPIETLKSELQGTNEEIDLLNFKINQIKFAQQDELSNINFQRLTECDKLDASLQIELQHLTEKQENFIKGQYQFCKLKESMYKHKLILQCVSLDKSNCYLKKTNLTQEEFTLSFISLLNYLTIIKFNTILKETALKRPLLAKSFLSPFSIATGPGIVILETLLKQEFLISFLQSNFSTNILISDEFRDLESLRNQLKHFSNRNNIENDFIFSIIIDEQGITQVETDHRNQEIELITYQCERNRQTVCELKSMLLSLQKDRERFMQLENIKLESSIDNLKKQYNSLIEELHEVNKEYIALEHQLNSLNIHSRLSYQKDYAMLSPELQEKYHDYSNSSFPDLSKHLRLSVVDIIKHLVDTQYTNILHDHVQPYYLNVLYYLTETGNENIKSSTKKADCPKPNLTYADFPSAPSFVPTSHIKKEANPQSHLEKPQAYRAELGNEESQKLQLESEEEIKSWDRVKKIEQKVNQQNCPQKFFNKNDSTKVKTPQNNDEPPKKHLSSLLS